MKMKKTIRKIIRVFFTLVTIAGLACLLYPTVSDILSAEKLNKVIEQYTKTSKQMPEKDYEKEFEKAREYNEKLYEQGNALYEPNKVSGYEDVLNVDKNGVMGYVSIPKINVKLPVFHGTDDQTLKNAVGHLKGSSVICGGENTHSVIAAHRGLMSARLFTDIDELEKGDTFSVTVLNKVLVYEVDSVQTVLPEETRPLEIIEGGDFVTLQTCTPYGINSHRLLVRGKHIKTLDADSKEAQKYVQGNSVMGTVTSKRNLPPVILSFSLIGIFATTTIIRNRNYKKMKGVKSNENHS